MQEFAKLDDKKVNEWDPRSSPSLKWLQDRVEELRAQQGLERSGKRIARSKTRELKKRELQAANIMLLSNDKLFDAVARSSLKASNHDDYSREIDHLVKGEAGWWFMVGNGHSHVIPNGIEITADIQVGAYARACYFNPDLKHFGE